MKTLLATALILLLSFASARGGPALPEQSVPPLTPAQKTSLLAVLATIKARVEPLGKQLLVLQAEVNDRMLAEEPDEAAIKNCKGRIIKLVGRMVEMRMDDIRTMLKVLSPEQRHVVKAEASRSGGEKDLFNVIVKKFGLPEK
jgi:hypothetical protein